MIFVILKSNGAPYMPLDRLSSLGVSSISPGPDTAIYGGNTPCVETHVLNYHL